MFANLSKSFLILTKFYKNKKKIKNIYAKKKENISYIKKSDNSNLNLKIPKQDYPPSFSLSSIKSKKNTFGNLSNGFISSNCSINKESNNSMRANIFNMMNMLTPKTISTFSHENYILNKLIETGNDFYKDIFKQNEIDKSKFKESLGNFSFVNKTPNFADTNDELDILNDNSINDKLINNFVNDKEKNSKCDYNNYVNISRKGNVVTFTEKKELVIIYEDDKDDKENNKDDKGVNNNNNDNAKDKDNEKLI